MRLAAISLGLPNRQGRTSSLSFHRDDVQWMPPYYVISEWECVSHDSCYSFDEWRKIGRRGVGECRSGKFNVEECR